MIIKFRTSLIKIFQAIAVLPLLFLPGIVLFFNSTPADKRISGPIMSGKSLSGSGFNVQVQFKQITAVKLITGDGFGIPVEHQY